MIYNYWMKIKINTHHKQLIRNDWISEIHVCTPAALCCWTTQSLWSLSASISTAPTSDVWQCCAAYSRQLLYLSHFFWLHSSDPPVQSKQQNQLFGIICQESGGRGVENAAMQDIWAVADIVWHFLMTSSKSPFNSFNSSKMTWLDRQYVWIIFHRAFSKLLTKLTAQLAAIRN